MLYLELVRGTAKRFETLRGISEKVRGNKVGVKLHSLSSRRHPVLTVHLTIHPGEWGTPDSK